MLRHFLATTAALAAFASAATNTGEPWGYASNDGTDGDLAPKDWASKYPNCGGDKQSPIDIPASNPGDAITTEACDKVPLTFSGECSTVDTLVSDHGITWTVSSDSTCAVTHGETKYTLLQYHVHMPSEHSIDGKFAAGAVHFVHQNVEETKYLVVGILLSTDGTDYGLDAVLNNYKGELEGELTEFDAYAVAGKAYKEGALYNYEGSLTTPDCDEIVDWWVVGEMVKVSDANAKKVKDLQATLTNTDNGNNSRPIQDLNARTITKYECAASSSTSKSGSASNSTSGSASSSTSGSASNSTSGSGSATTEDGSGSGASTMALSGAVALAAIAFSMVL